MQIKRYDPEGSRSNIERKDVALFQRDAASKGAERAVFVTLGSFSKAARKAATDTTPHVNLIDGERIWELVERKSHRACARRRSSTRRGSTGSTDEA